MNGDKKMDSSASYSFTSDLFGSNESSDSSSSGILGFIFSPSSKVLGRESLRSEVVEKKQHTVSQFWTTKSGAAQDTIPRRSDGENQSPTNKDKSHFYQEQKVQPCHLSSSIYYGGQDVYSPPQRAQDSGHTTFHNVDEGEDDSGSASRGNWWQGSLYY